ncbi:MAG TPA: hypothetical protein PKD59_14400 [Miltoncostaeaceae bacterium]|nr:hypothetical protein [Miltoncostaeaceae bacterium]
MRRGGPPMLPVDPAAVPAVARVERGPRGLRFAQAGDGAAPGPHSGPLRARAAAPVPAREAAVVAGGKLALLTGAGAAFSLRLPQVVVIHDRRPPGLDRTVGAADANAGLLHADGGWRAVVLPSLGDIAVDLGPGPVAIRADGRAVAAVAGDEVVEWSLGDDGPPARRPGGGDAIAFASDGSVWVAAGAAPRAPGDAAVDGPAITSLAAAAAAPVLVARHEDDIISVWRPGAAEPAGSWPSPVPRATSLAVSADGELIALGSPDGADPVAALLTTDGAIARLVEGARVIAPSPARDGLLVAGDWGCAWLTPLEEDA